MPEKPTEPHPPLDVRNIHQLVRLMKRYDLSAIDLVDGATKIRLRRRGSEGVAAAPGLVATAPAAAIPPAATPAPSNESVIESPMVGTFYSSPAPDAPSFVSVGTAVRPETTVCVIEAMKVFTDIPAGLSGTVTEVLVKNGQPVEFGQALFRVRPA
jgi:acetyl-CoA carboxylase biotin carboxyl carrier protein